MSTESEMMLSVNCHYPRYKRAMNLGHVSGNPADTITITLSTGGYQDITLFFSGLAAAQEFVSATQAGILELAGEMLA